MGFSLRCIGWMEGCIFSSSIFVLINGITTKDFKVDKGLLQGDPLSHFLFVLVMEVLTALVRKAKEVGEFRGFRVNEEEEIHMLQFADDTIIISERDTANIWSMKAIFRGFELMSGLRINFNNRVGDWFLEATSTFLSCRVGSFPFKFLGVKVGENPKNTSMWKDLISFLRRRLAVWRGNNLNRAGRVVLINSVLNVIPIYSLSFYKDLSKLIQDIQSIQSKFLWGGSDLKRSIHWMC